jgi:hypothetical protein
MKSSNVRLICENTVLRRSVEDELRRCGHRVHVWSRTAGSAGKNPNEPPRDLSARVEPLDDERHPAPTPAWDVLVVVERSVTGALGAEPRRSEAAWVHQLVTAASAKGRRVVRVCPRAALPDHTPAEAPTDDQSDVAGDVLTVRTSVVYGTSDDPLTLFLMMMRSLPTVPILGDAFVLQPVWHEDLARAVAASVDPQHASAPHRSADVAGPDIVTQGQLYDAVAELIDRRPLKVPVPAPMSALANAELELVPLQPWLKAFHERPALVEPAVNALAIFGVTPTRVETGLVRLVTQLAELTPLEGVGSVEIKRFSAEIRGTSFDAAGLLRAFRSHFKDVMPIGVGVEPVLPQTTLTEGATLTLALPARGHVAVRVEDVSDSEVVLATLRGHAVAGFVRFDTRDVPEGVRFGVTTCDAAGNALDWVALTLGGARLQDANWTRVVENVVQLAGGVSHGVESDARTLAAEEAATAQDWIQRVIARRRAGSTSIRRAATP